MEAYGTGLRRLRGSRTRQEMARALGISPQALQAYEEGRRWPRDEVKLRIRRMRQQERRSSTVSQ